MTDQLTPAVAPATPVPAPAGAPAARSPFSDDRGGNRGGGGNRRGRQPRQSRDQKPRSEYDQKIVDIRRVTRVVAGGRRFSFSVVLAVGNRKGTVGLGMGKAGDTALAIDKALRDAKKKFLHLSLSKNMSIPHEIEAKYASARVFMSPAAGRGLIAGSAVRQILELAGIKDTMAKIRSGSKNRLNIARVTIDALSQLPQLTPAQKSERAAAAKDTKKF